MEPIKISNPDQVKFKSWNEFYKHVKGSLKDENDPFLKIIYEPFTDNNVIEQYQILLWELKFKVLEEYQDLMISYNEMEVVRIALYDTLTAGAREVIPKINRLKRLCKSDN